MAKVQSRTKKSTLNVIVGSLSQIVSLLISFLSRTVFIIYLGNDYLSVNGLFSNILTLLSFTDLGIGSAILYSLYKPIAEDDKEKVGRLINLFKRAYNIIAAVICLLGLILVPFLQYIISNVPDVKESIELLYILFLANTVLSYLWGYKKSYLMADQKNYVVNIFHLCVNIFQVVAQILILILTHNFILFLMVMIGCTVLNNVGTTLYVNHTYPWILQYEHLKIHKDEQISIFQNIKNIFIYKVGSTFLGGSSSIIISAFIKTSLVGICSNYSLLINAVTGIINQGITGVVASIGNYNVQSTPQENRVVFNELCMISFWIFGMVSLLLCFLLNPFINIWLGEFYVLPQSVVIAIVLGFYSVVINSIPSSYRQAMGLFRESRFAPIYATIINLVLSIFGALYMGLFGVFIATFIARITTYCVIDPYYIHKKGFGVSPVYYYAEFGAQFVILLFTYIICMLLFKLLATDGLLCIVERSIACLIVYNLLFIPVYSRKPYFKSTLIRLKQLKK